MVYNRYSYSWFKFCVSIEISGAHITTEKLENAGLFVRLGLPSTLICHENEAFRKLKTELFTNDGVTIIT